MNVHDAILSKRAVREFTPAPLTETEILTILKAGRRAQSAKNIQPWQYIVIREKAILLALSQMGTYAGHLAGAAMAVAILTPDPASRFSVMFDAGQSAAYMQLAAWEIGVGSCPATIYEPEKARSLLGFPEDLHLRITLSFGYPLHPETLTAPPQRPGRKSLEELVHWDRW